MSLDAIPIHVVPAGAGLSGNAPPLLRELTANLRRLLDTGEPAAIDLSALPLSPADLDWLRAQLGEGEIVATLHAYGESTLAETGFSGVWWVTHHDEAGSVVSQFLEVTFVPELVKAHPADIEMSLEQLELLVNDT